MKGCVSHNITHEHVGLSSARPERLIVVITVLFGIILAIPLHMWMCSLTKKHITMYIHSICKWQKTPAESQLEFWSVWVLICTLPDLLGFVCFCNFFVLKAVLCYKNGNYCCFFSRAVIHECRPNTALVPHLQLCRFSLLMMLHRDQLEPRGAIVVIPRKLQLMKTVQPPPLITLCVWGSLCAVWLLCCPVQLIKKDTPSSGLHFLFFLLLPPLHGSSSSLGRARSSRGFLSSALSISVAW